MRLSRETIHKIVLAVHEGEQRSAIAGRFRIDVTTVNYHVEKFIVHHGTLAAIVQIAAPKVCCHPSLKCLVCGRAQDYLHRRELEYIRNLRRALDEASKTLISLGYEPPKIGGV